MEGEIIFRDGRRMKILPRLDPNIRYNRIASYLVG